MRRGFAVAFVASCIICSITCVPQRALHPGWIKGPKWLERARELVDSGEFGKARGILAEKALIQGFEGWTARWEIERMRRISLDFPFSYESMKKSLERRIRPLNDSMMRRWMKEGLLRFMRIDGTTWFFRAASRSLMILRKRGRPRSIGPSANPRARRAEILFREAMESGERYVHPRRFRVEFSLEAVEGAVPPGAMVRCWLPFPRESERQREIKLISAEPSKGAVAPSGTLQRTLYLEARMPEKGGLKFKEVFEFTCLASVITRLDPRLAKPLDPGKRRELSKWLGPGYPHVVTGGRIKSLALKICGGEKNPLAKAKRIFQWMQENIIWLPAREYCTIKCIPYEVLKNRYGDCGMQALLMISLLRAAGIPARWQSGWGMEPERKGMHDWLRFYVEPWGWIHADPSRGFIKSGDQRVRWFHFGNLDTWRWTICDGWGCELSPPMVHFRADPVDFQRGEIEWEGGSLYYDRVRRYVRITEKGK